MQVRTFGNSNKLRRSSVPGLRIASDLLVTVLLVSASVAACGSESWESSVSDSANDNLAESMAATERQATLERSCFCHNCFIEPDGERSANYRSASTNIQNIKSVGCSYVRWAYFPWGRISNASAAKDYDTTFFTEFAAAATELNGTAVIEFGLPETVTQGFLDSIHVSNSERQLLNSITAQAGIGLQLAPNQSQFTFAEVVKKKMRRDGVSGIPVVSSVDGWNYHLLMNIRALNAGAGGLYFSQTHHRLNDDLNNLKVFEALVRALRSYARATLARDIIIGVEALTMYKPGDDTSELYDFAKYISDIDVVSPGVPPQVDTIDGRKLGCRGAAFLDSTITTRTNRAGQRVGNICWAEPEITKNPTTNADSLATRIYDSYFGRAGRGADFTYLNESHIPVMMEFDGCQNCRLKNGTAEYVVYYQDLEDERNNELQTECSPRVRNGLSNTMLYISQPASVRRAFNRYMAKTTEALRLSGQRVYFPQMIQVDQNFYWELMDGDRYGFGPEKFQRLKDRVRFCPEEIDGPGRTYPPEYPKNYHANVCGDLDSVREALGGTGGGGSSGPGDDPPVLKPSVTFEPGHLTIEQGRQVETQLHRLVMENDGNLVLYKKMPATKLWSTETQPRSCSATTRCKATFQTDGNLVVYFGTEALWNTKTWSHGTSFVFSDSEPHLAVFEGAARIWSTASNTPATYPLQVTKSGTGRGLVTSSPGIQCGTDCSENYPANTSVTLDAVAETGSTFSGWSGACSGTSSRCVVNMRTARQDVVATFSVQASSPWVPVAGNLLTDIAVGSDGSVWGIDSGLMIYRRSGSGWERVPGQLHQISVGSASHVWGVGAAARIYRRDGNAWTEIPGGLRQVSVGSDGSVWGIGSGGSIYRRVGSSWERVSGQLEQISVGSASQVWGVNAAGLIYRRDGDSWTNIAGELRQVSVGSDGTVWGINSAGIIYRRAGNRWEMIPGSLRQIAVGSANQVWGLTSDNQIRRYAP
ncbi:MAG: hypothetical protein IPK13_25005 [Deltaproteobacteria bacterium]|nr:hypothetical protein [Deltaproteobacteria bacterium]